MSSPDAASARSDRRVLLLPLVWIVAVNLPGRLRLAADEARFGIPPLETLVGGLAADLAILTLPLMLLLALPMFAAAQPKGRLGRALVTLLAASLLALSWLMSVSATETKQQLGFYPTLYEARGGLGNRAFVAASVSLVIGERYRLPNLVGGAVTAAALWLWLRALFTGRVQLRAQLRATLVGCLTATVLLAIVVRSSAHLGHVRQLYPPWTTFLRSFVPIRKTSQFSGLRSVYQDRVPDPERARRGAKRLGLPPLDEDDGRACAPHPLGRALDAPPTSELGRAAQQASATLFADGVAPDAPIVWHLLLESFRGDDLSALNPQAPAALLPMVNDLYQQRRGGIAIAFSHAYPSGVRTAQALGAALCGIGVLPFNTTIVRDLGRVPLRCLPDVLADAGLRPRMTYAAELSFDNMLDFVRYHGLQTIEPPQLPAGLPHGTWGSLTDRALLDSLPSRVDDGPRYEVVLTLANHTPYDLPEDVTPALMARVDGLLAGRPPIADLDRRRLITMAATDEALGAFLTRLDETPLGARSLVVVHADHATAETTLWGEATPRALAQIPLVVYVPRTWSSKLTTRAGLQPLVDYAARQPIVLADVPELVLDLLTHSPSLRRVSAPWRWHTLGGAALRAPPPLPSIDASSRLLRVDAQGATPTGEVTPPFGNASDFEALGTEMQDAADLTSAFLRGYGARCTDEKWLRASAAR